MFLSSLAIFILVGVLGFILWLVFDMRKKTSGGDDKLAVMLDRLESLSQENVKLRESMDNKLSETHEAAQKQVGQSSKLIEDVTEKLTKLEKTNEQVINFSAQLQNLQEILKNPKQRGILGEYRLETLLRNAFTTTQYKMQYNLGKDEKTGQDLIVDAALFFGEKILPIDSKFSLENYNKIIEEKDPLEKERLEKQFKQDLKSRIDETSKYIQPNKGTTDYAFMFIPAEGIYSDLLEASVGAIKVNTRDLIDYAVNEKKVHIVSPTTFYVYLQSLYQGMREFTIQEETKEILVKISMLDKHLKSYEEYLRKLGNHLGTAVSSYNNAFKEYGKIDKDIAKINKTEARVEPMALDKPKNE